ncbi:hypothetical protein WMO40_20525 [Bacillaceae bacterium CLA-AA-H227]|uniref:Uncharacterized protein n=1 Tax=Robertmurraya yapensis (ex Hitch et al 2024) TaxID=3133160 RepID=A0ACC6SG98_9BACI
MKNKTKNLLILVNSLLAIILGVFAWVYFIQPEDGLGVNLFVKKFSAGGFFFTFIISFFVNGGILLYDRINR